MQIACSSWSFHRQIPQQMHLLDFPAWCGSRGISVIELVDNQLPSWEGSYLTELRRACMDAGVQVACLAAANDFTIPDADKLFAQVQRMRTLLYDVAKPLGAPVMRVFLGMSDTTPAGDQRALETFRGMVTDLEATGISFALENHARVQTPPEKMAAIIAGVESPLFGSCLDFGCLPESRRYMALVEQAPYAKHVHAKSYAFTPAGEEQTIDYQRALAILTEHGYDGVISIEYEGDEEAAKGVLATKALIEHYWYHPEQRLAA